jgi:hypothetical protein
MNRYESSIPRAALGFAAAALATMTLGLSVIAPAKMESGNPEARSLAASRAVTPAATEVALGAGRIVVVAAREPALSTMQVRHLQPAQPKRKQQS